MRSAHLVRGQPGEQVDVVVRRRRPGRRPAGARPPAGSRPAAPPGACPDRRAGTDTSSRRRPWPTSASSAAGAQRTLQRLRDRTRSRPSATRADRRPGRPRCATGERQSPDGRRTDLGAGGRLAGWRSGHRSVVGGRRQPVGAGPPRPASAVAFGADGLDPALVGSTVADAARPAWPPPCARARPSPARAALPRLGPARAGARPRPAAGWSPRPRRRSRGRARDGRPPGRGCRSCRCRRRPRRRCSGSPSRRPRPAGRSGGPAAARRRSW